MGDDRAVRGVLFDSGGVLIRPVGGRWNPRYDFEEIVLRHHSGIEAELFPAAFAAGQLVLDAGTTTANRTEYHRAMLRVLGVPRPDRALLSELEAPAAGPAVEPYPEVRPVLDRLRAAGVPMCVVSDNWAGLERLFRQLDLERYFAGFVISEVLGCRKPDPRMYRAGSDALALRPAECLFVDDDVRLVEAAVALGYRGAAIPRGPHPPTRVPVIAALDEVFDLIG